MENVFSNFNKLLMSYCRLPHLRYTSIMPWQKLDPPSHGTIIPTIPISSILIFLNSKRTNVTNRFLVLFVYSAIAMWIKTTDIVILWSSHIDLGIIFLHLSSSTCRNPPTTVATLTGNSSARSPVSLKATRTWLTLWTKLPLMASLSLTPKWTPFWRNETFWPGSSKPAPLKS